jgi:hypothetical protein
MPKKKELMKTLLRKAGVEKTDPDRRKLNAIIKREIKYFQVRKELFENCVV